MKQGDHIFLVDGSGYIFREMLAWLLSKFISKLQCATPYEPVPPVL